VRDDEGEALLLAVILAKARIQDQQIRENGRLTVLFFMIHRYWILTFARMTGIGGMTNIKRI
jgi:hypothetical protein